MYLDRVRKKTKHGELYCLEFVELFQLNYLPESFIYLFLSNKIIE